MAGSSSKGGSFDLTISKPLTPFRSTDLALAPRS